MKKAGIYILSLFALALGGCIDETYFGESVQADIVTFSIEGEMSNKIDPLVDWRDVGTVKITVPATFDLKYLKVTNAVCSQLAHFTTNPDTLTDFSNPVELFVVAENQAVVKRWIVTVTQEEVTQAQIPFSEMTQWTPARTPAGAAITIKGQPGYFPGNGTEFSPWRSTAESNAISLSGLSEFSVTPNTGNTTAQYAKIVTLETKSGALLGTGVATGAIFVGEFILNASLVTGAVKEPRKMVNSGTPFYGRPKAVKFDIRYQPGAQMMDGKLKPIAEGTGKPMKDSCDIYIILHNRLSDPSKFIRVAAASLRDGAIGNINDDVNGFVSYEIPFIYGEPTAEQLLNKPYAKIGGSHGELTFHKFTKNGDNWDISATPVKEVYAADPENTSVDNIVIMFSSSAYGDEFYAAPGSRLDVKNIQLVY